MKRIPLNILIIYLSCVVGCTSNDQNLENAKVNCYADKLKQLKEESLYKEVMNQFSDTLNEMKIDAENFGHSDMVKTKVDEAIFFNKSKTQCLLIVLIKSNYYKLVFGDTRIIQGIMREGKWLFEPSIKFTYSNSYYDAYTENSFENISKLARKSVLTHGEIKRKGCDIDEYYWFEYLKK